MPILKDFKPDLIINSAGRDTHYSDPTTNMNFSAQGYADLTAMLKPDIAVLEGGYSIEGALPYVNVGIILAMAGVDYSKEKSAELPSGKYPADTSGGRSDRKNECKEIDYRWYDTADTGQFDMIFLQDRTEDK